MQSQDKVSWISKVGQRIWGRTFWAIMVVVGAVIVANLFDQSWILGPAGVLAWFITYPSLGGRPRPNKSVGFDDMRGAKAVGVVGKTEKAGMDLRFSSGREQIQFVRYAANVIDTSLKKSGDARAVRASESLVADLWALERLISLLLVKIEANTDGSESDRGGVGDVDVDQAPGKVVQWSAQVDHAVSLVEIILLQVQAGTLDLEAWSAVVKHEVTWLEVELVGKDAPDATITVSDNAQ